MTLIELVCGDTVPVRNHLYGQVKLAPGTVIRRLGPLTYLIQEHSMCISTISDQQVMWMSLLLVTQYYHITIYLQLYSVPNHIVTPISENIENCESSTVEKGIPKISHVKTPLRRLTGNIKKLDTIDL